MESQDLINIKHTHTVCFVENKSEELTDQLYVVTVIQARDEMKTWTRMVWR